MYKVGELCFYYDTKQQKLKEGSIQSVRKTEYDDGNGFEITSVEYSIRCNTTHHCGVGSELLFGTKEEFLKAIT